jgi:SSS family solute:Na+ symporter/sodium/proline symporter
MLGGLAIAGLGLTGSETIVIRVSLDVLPTLLGILLLAGAAAIVVSTANSMLLTSATSLVRDVCQRFVNPAATDAQIVLYTRTAIAALGTIAVIGGSVFPTILAMALWAYTIYGAGITPALLAALLWPRATREAAVASILSGGITTIVWEVAGLTSAGYPLGVATVYPALLASVGTLVGTTIWKR